MFGFFKKKRKPAADQLDPLTAFDSVIESVERQASEVRRSAATLIALRRDLKRDVEKLTAQVTDLEARQAEAQGDVLLEKTLTRDLFEAKSRAQQTTTGLAKVEADATLLMEAAEELGRKVASLKEERQSAKVRFSAGVVVTDALRTQVEQFDRVLKLDAARDEIEKAHALAELYREDDVKKTR